MKQFLLLSVVIITFLTGSVMAQERVVSGRVTAEESGGPIPGVNVILKGTTIGTVTDIDGFYQLNVPEEGGTLIYTFIGLATEEVRIGDQSQIDMLMTADIRQLTEVVVTALGIEREERSLGYSIQEVEGEELNNVPTDNFLNSLSGRVAGLQIKNNSNFGGSNNVVIRGQTSLTQNNQPLFVVDGVPVSNSNTNNAGQLTGRSGYDYGNAASDINPDDIASISVLKGAAASALYGSRAANGVILITTKKGKAGRGIGVSINSNTTFGVVDKETLPAFQHEYGAGYGPYYSGGDYPYLAEEDVDGDGTPDLVVPFTEDASRGQEFDPNLLVYQYNAFVPESPYFGQPTPWIAGKNDPHSFFETAVNLTNSVDISNATDEASYRIGYTNQNFSGIMPNSELERNNFILNGSYNILDNIKVSASANYIKTNAQGRPSTGYSDNIMSMYRQWYQMNVDVQEQKDLYFQTGRNVTWNRLATDDPHPIYWDNPYWTRYENYQSDVRTRLIGYAMAEWDITDFLNLMGRYTIDTYDQLQEERRAVGSIASEFGVDRPDVQSGYARFDRTWRETNIDGILKFQKRFGEIDLSALAGINIRRNYIDDVYASTSGGLAVPGLYALSNSVDPMLPPEESLLESGVNGIFGGATIGYMDMIYLEGTIRRDESSTLPEGNNTYVYPSVSGTFVFSELLNSSWLSLGKLRLNYAEVGSDAPPLRVKDTYRGVAPYAGVSMVTNYFAKNNSDLKPERTQAMEAGLAMNFLTNRVGFDVAVYRATTFDQLMPVTVTTATGYSSTWVNSGEIENKGIELTLFATPIETSSFRWDIALNWSKNQNEVIELFTDQAGNKVENLQLGALQGGLTINARVGQPYGAIQGTDYVYHENGQPIVNPNGRYQISSTNDVVLGNYNPDWIAGIRNSFSYKDFTLSFLLDGQHGGDVFSLDLWYGTGTGMYEETAGVNELGNPKRDPIVQNEDGSYAPNTGGLLNPGVYEDGTPNETRVRGDYYAADGWQVSPNARFVYDASYLKLRELALTYNFPRSLIDQTPLTGASLSFIGSNLWIIDKNLPHADPEASQSSGNIQGWQSGVMPTTKNYGFNVKIQF
ncbi:MAG: SusC/RagA family TonB-linked outer membrane protein [Cyclobacteriaceae bacterium]|nr:SusC/RagA family TonB-linked outer membrane protein [Cyclobacteriaceae bacterium]